MDKIEFQNFLKEIIEANITKQNKDKIIELAIQNVGDEFKNELQEYIKTLNIKTKTTYEKQKDAQKKYYEKNKDKIIQRQKEYYQRNKKN